MAAPDLNPTTRYTPPGIRDFYWVTTIATYTSPTRAELNAGVRLTKEVADISGWTLDASTQDAPDLGSKFNSQVDGRISAADSSMSFWASQNSNDARTVLPRGTVGNMCYFPEGDVTGQKYEIWPAKVRSMYIDPAMEDVAKIVVQFAILKIPAQNVTIP